MRGEIVEGAREVDDSQHPLRRPSSQAVTRQLTWSDLFLITMATVLQTGEKAQGAKAGASVKRNYQGER